MGSDRLDCDEVRLYDRGVAALGALAERVTALQQGARSGSLFGDKPPTMEQVEAAVLQDAEQRDAQQQRQTPAGSLFNAAARPAQPDRAGVAESGDEGGQPTGRGRAASENAVSDRGTPNAEVTPEFQLESETNAGIARREQAQRQQAQQDRRAVPNAKSFTLTGSDRDADVGAAAGQKSLFSSGEENPNVRRRSSVSAGQRPDRRATTSLDVAAGRPGPADFPNQLTLLTPKGRDSAFPEKTRSAIESHGRKVGLIRRGTFKSGISQVTTPEQAAHVMAPLRKQAQESMMALVTDKDNRVLGIIRHTVGKTNAADVQSSILMGAVHSIPNAANVWFAHNHPSGMTDQSTADLNVTRHLHKNMLGTGIKTHGMIVVGPGGKASYYQYEGAGSHPVSIEPHDRKQHVPVIERHFTKMLQSESPIRQPSDLVSRAQALSGGREGVLVLDTRRQPTAFVPMTAMQMLTLRSSEVGTGASKLLQAIHEGNGTSLVPFIGHGHRASAENVGAFGGDVGVPVMDVAEKQPDGTYDSLEERGANRTGASPFRSVLDGSTPERAEPTQHVNPPRSGGVSRSGGEAQERPGLSRDAGEASPADYQRAAAKLRSLTQDDEFFRYPVSKSKDLAEIAKVKDPAIQVSDPQEPPAAMKAQGVHAVWTIHMPDAAPAYARLYKDGRVMLDASRLSSGHSHGSALYDTLFNFAHNHKGMRFVGDMEGLSDKAVFRRSENMLNGALKYGTTQHMLPHERQVNGEAGAHPLKWTASDLQNVSNLLETVHKNIVKAVPGIADLRYNIDHEQFFNARSGHPVTKADFERLAATRGAQATGAGRTSLERAALVNTLLRKDGQGVRDGVLPENAQLGSAERRPGSQSAPKIKDTPLAKIGYSRTEEPQPRAGVSRSGGRSQEGASTPSRITGDGTTTERTNGIPQGLKAEKSIASGRLTFKFNRWREAVGLGGRAEFREIPRHVLPDSVGRSLDAIETLTGAKVHVIRNLTPEVDKFNGITLRDGHLYVDEDAPHPVTAVAAHEFTHQLRRDAPYLYQQLEAEVRRQGRVKDWQQELSRRVKSETVDDKLAAEELTANAVGDALSDPEFLQRMAKRNPSKFADLVHRFMAYLNGLMNKARGLGSEKYLSDVSAFRDKLAEVLDRYSNRQGAELAREGDAPSMARERAPDAFRPDPQEADVYREKLRKTMASSRTNVDPIPVGRTSAVLRALGAKDRPLTISRDVVRKATNGVKHIVPMSAIEKLPEELSDPLAVFQSRTHPDSLVAITEMSDSHGNPVIAAVDLRDHPGHVEINRIASVYGKDGVNPFARWAKEGLLKYESKRARSSSSLKGLQLPNRLLAKENGPVDILHESDITSTPRPPSSERPLFARGDGPLGDEVKTEREPARAARAIGLDIHDEALMRAVGRGALDNAYAKLDRLNIQTAHALRGWGKHFDTMLATREGTAAIDQAINEWESGQEVGDAKLRPFFDSMKQAFDQRVNAVRATGRTVGYVENYFPHLYKDPKKAAQWAAGYVARHPLEGTKGYTKQRFYDTLKAAREAGLEPRFENPADMVMAHINQLDKYIAMHQVRTDLEARGLVKKDNPDAFRKPDGWAKVNDPAFHGQLIPQMIANDINTTLSSGVRDVGAVRAWLNTKNSLVSLQLGLSGFHATMTTGDTIASHLSDAILRTLMGDGRGAIDSLAMTVASPVLSPKQGHLLIKQSLGEAPVDAQTAAILRMLEQGGHKVAMSSLDHNQSHAQLAKLLRQGAWRKSYKGSAETAWRASCRFTKIGIASDISVRSWLTWRAIVRASTRPAFFA